MHHSISCGIIPVRRKNNAWELLIVQLHAGHWGFPKGHVENNEELQVTAVRELLEETGLHIKAFLSDETFEENYCFTHQGQRIAKKVIYFLAEVEGDLVIQEEEIKAAKWVLLSESVKDVTFSPGKAICDRVNTIL